MAFTTICTLILGFLTFAALAIRPRRTKLTVNAALALAAAMSLMATPALADPLTGEILKYEQLPLNNGLAPSVGGAPFWGRDERSTAYLNTNGTPGYTGGYVADDFSDKVSTPVVHVQWWGSYANDYLGVVPGGGVNQFMISFADDVPAANGVPSHPGNWLSSEIVNLGGLSPASGTYSEKMVNPAPGDDLYVYNAELANPFPEQANIIYWMSIVALTNDPIIGWGWHNRDYQLTNALFAPVVPGETNIGSAAFPVMHFQDDAVVGGIVNNVHQVGFAPLFYQGPDDHPVGVGPFSEDLAFRLFTNVPEPGSVVLFGMGALGLAFVAYRRRRVRVR